MLLGKVIFTVNKVCYYYVVFTVKRVADRKHYFTTSYRKQIYEAESATSCQCMENNTHLLSQKQLT